MPQYDGSTWVLLFRGLAGLRSLASPLLILGPAPARACNAVCNEKSKQGTAVRHDRNVFLLDSVPRKNRKRRRKRKKRRNNIKKRRRVQKESCFGPKRKTNVIVHLLSLCWSSLTNRFLPSLPPALFHFVCSGGQWHSLKMSTTVPPLL